jgi:hypothetical protein
VHACGAAKPDRAQTRRNRANCARVKAAQTANTTDSHLPDETENINESIVNIIFIIKTKTSRRVSCEMNHEKFSRLLMFKNKYMITKMRKISD